VSRVGVITNPTSGSGRGMAWGHQALAELAARGHQVNNLSRGSWEASYEAAMRERRRLDALVVVGGDGMVHLGLQVCAEKKLPLGIVAAGSGDDIAQTLGLPHHDIPGAIDRIDAGLAGDVIEIDLGKVSGKRVEKPAAPRYFGAVLSAGVDAAVAAYARRITRPRGPAKYKVATARELMRFKPYSVTVSADGREWTQLCTLVAVANAPIFGGGLRISPHSSVTDGKLELVLANALSRRDIVRLFPKLNDGSHASDPRISFVKADKVTISQGDGGAKLPPAFADGELVGGEPITVEVVPRALRVLGARTG
jgi:diacylglycerol kinase (ATP)